MDKIRIQFRELLDAFYGSIERFVCRYDGEILRYSFFGKRAASFVKLVEFVARLGGGDKFVLEFGRAISSRWNIPPYVLFQLPSDFPDLGNAKPDRVDVTVNPRGGEFVLEFHRFTWAAKGERREKIGQGAIALTLNEARMKRYRV